MKKKTIQYYKNIYKKTLFTGIAIMIIGILATAFLPALDETLKGILINVGLVMILIGFVRLVKAKEMPVKDEMTKKIANQSAAYSWVVTIFVLIIIFWLNHFNVLKFSVNGVIAVTYTFMVFSMIAFQKYYWKKGDIE